MYTFCSAFSGIEYASSFGRCEVWTRAEGIQAVKVSFLGRYWCFCSLIFLTQWPTSKAQPRMLDLRTTWHWRWNHWRALEQLWYGNRDGSVRVGNASFRCTSTDSVLSSCPVQVGIDVLSWGMVTSARNSNCTAHFTIQQMDQSIDFIVGMHGSGITFDFPLWSPGNYFLYWLQSIILLVILQSVCLTTATSFEGFWEQQLLISKFILDQKRCLKSHFVGACAALLPGEGLCQKLMVVAFLIDRQPRPCKKRETLVKLLVSETLEIVTNTKFDFSTQIETLFRTEGLPRSLNLRCISGRP